MFILFTFYVYLQLKVKPPWIVVSNWNNYDLPAKTTACEKPVAFRITSTHYQASVINPFSSC